MTVVYQQQLEQWAALKDDCQGYTSLNQLGLAIEQGRQAVELARQLFGDCDIRTAESLYRQGTAYFHGKDYQSAKEYLGEAVRIADEKPEQDPEVAAAIFNQYGLLQQDLHKIEKAETYFWKAIHQLELRFGKNHVKTAEVYGNLSVLCESTQRLEDGVRWRMKTIDILQTYQQSQVLRTDEYYEALLDLAIMYRNQGFHQYKVRVFESSREWYGRCIDSLQSLHEAGFTIPAELLDKVYHNLRQLQCRLGQTQPPSLSQLQESLQAMY